MTTSRDVARLAGVSQSTVSYVLTGKRPISEKTRQRVQGAIEQLTFHPNAGARALASQRTRVVGLVAPLRHSRDQPGMWPFIETIASGVRRHDHDLLLVTGDEGAEGLARVVGRRIVDALVVMDVAAHDERLDVARTLEVPVIVIGIPDDPGDLACVDLDFAAAGRLAVDEVTESGCRSAVVLGYSRGEVERGTNYVRRFTDAAERRAEELGLPVRVVSPVEPERSAVDAALDAALAERGGDGRLPGLVVPQTAAIPVVLRSLRDRSLVPGRDVTVVGLCTDSAAAELDPPVSNVSSEPRDVSQRAVETLFHLLEPPDGAQAAPPGVELVQPRLTRRATSGGPEARP